MTNNSKFILYLDLDGVLTSENFIVYTHNCLTEYNENKNKNTLHCRNFLQRFCFQQEGIDYLNKLYNEIQYDIVLSSTRRVEFSLDNWNFIFNLNKIKPKIIGITPHFSFNKDRYTWREDEIYKYHFIDNKLNNIPFIIIDDDIFDLQKYKDRLIKVNTESGLTLDYYNETLEKLKNQGVKYEICND